MLSRLAVLLTATAAAFGLPDAAAAVSPAPLTEPPEELARALECSDDLDRAARAPVILLHGTGSNPEESFDSGYGQALPKEGFPVCTVRFPERGTVDLQRSMQYVVFAIREAARRSGRKVSLVGHSQGGLHAVYAPHFWPDLPAKVEDVVGLAAPYEGTQRANEDCMDGRCGATSWQFRFGSDLNRVFAATRRPTGPSFTAVATANDELVTPAPDAALLRDATSIVLQDVCPRRSTEHFAMVGDAAAYALALDALNHDGPADPARFDPATCRQTTIAGGDPAATFVGGPGAIGNALVAITTAEQVDREPRLTCPFDAGACPPGTATPADGGKRGARRGLRLTRSCLLGGPLRVRLEAQGLRVRRVDFRARGRVVARDRRAPFVRVLPRRVVRRVPPSRLRAVAFTERGRVAVSRTFPRCGLRG